MSWLCIILALIVGMIAIGGGYQNYVAHSSVGGTLPPYIVAVTLLIFLCSICLAYSASRWRKHEFKAFQEFISVRNLSYKYDSFVSRHQQVCVIIQ